MGFVASFKRIVGRFLQRKVCGVLPLHYIIPWIITMAYLKHVVSIFNDNYARYPLLTTMAVNGLLGGIADTVAQTITAVRANRAHRAWVREQNAAEQAGIALDEKRSVDTAVAAAENGLPRAAAPADSFDADRLLRFVTYGVVMAPAQFGWFKLLNKTFPMGTTASMAPAVKRMACDQVVFAPVGVATFFTAMTLAEGGRMPEIKKKLNDMYVPTLLSNWLVWPAVQLINFRLMPVQFQLPFVSSVGIAWTAYLSLTNAAEDEVIREHPPAHVSLV